MRRAAGRLYALRAVKNCNGPACLLMAVDPEPAPTERIRKRVLFVEEIVERVERVGVSAAGGRGFLDGEVRCEEPVGQALCSGGHFVALVADMSVHLFHVRS